MKARSRIALGFAAVSAAAMLAVGIMPAGAAPGVSASVTTVSPKLKFPCVTAAAVANLATFTAWAGGTAMPNLTGCTGTLHTTNALPGNTVTVTTAGTDFSISGTGAYAGAPGSSYNYEEPCVGGNSGATGEAYGTLQENISASGVFGTNVYQGPATMYANFYWSRVGVTAITGLGTVKVIAGSNTRTIGKASYAYDTATSTRHAGAGDAQTGISLSVFDLTADQLTNGCASTADTTKPGDIQITSTNYYASAS